MGLQNTAKDINPREVENSVNSKYPDPVVNVNTLEVASQLTNNK